MDMLKTDTSARPQDTHLFTLRVLCGFLILDDFLMSTSVVFTHPGWKWRKKKDKGSFRCAGDSKIIINELLCRVSKYHHDWVTCSASEVTTATLCSNQYRSVLQPCSTREWQAHS